MEEVKYRPVRETEIDETVGIFLTAVTDMYRRHGINTPAPERTVIEKHYRHIFETGIYHVAEVDGRVAAVCHAVVRDHLWFLSGYWMLPEFQRRKIGGTLLRGVRAEGERAGASTFFTWSSVDMTAMAGYMKIGMLPGYQILTFGGALQRELPERRAGYEAQPLEIASAVALDIRVRATGREADHRFWLAQPGVKGRQLVSGGRVTGYYYLNHGVIGPAAWDNTKDAEALMEAACREAMADASQVRLMVPGINHTAIRFALNGGLRLVAYSHLLTTAPFGQMQQYLPSGPSLF